MAIRGGWVLMPGMRIRSPSIDIYEPTPESQKLPAEHLLWCFTTSFKLAGLNWSPFLILTNLLCFPWTKKFVWKQYFFQSSRLQNSFFGNSNLLFCIFLVISCFFSGILAFRLASSRWRGTVYFSLCELQHASNPSVNQNSSFLHGLLFVTCNGCLDVVCVLKA